MKIKRKKLNELKAAPYNPRQMSERAFEGLKESIGRFGFVEPIIWNERTGNIVGGHQRWRSLLELGETEVDVVAVDLDEEEEKVLNVTLNNPEVKGNWTNFANDLLKASQSISPDAYEGLLFNELQETLDEIKESVSDHKNLTKCPCCDYEWEMGASDFEVLTREQMECLLNGEDE